VRLISVSTVVLIKGQNGPYVASTIFSTYHFNIYPILIQIPFTLYNKPYITSIFFLIFILKEYFPPYILTHVTSKTNAQCPPRGEALRFVGSAIGKQLTNPKASRFREN
jgi:hypothetical protein